MPIKNKKVGLLHIYHADKLDLKARKKLAKWLYKCAGDLVTANAGLNFFERMVFRYYSHV